MKHLDVVCAVLHHGDQFLAVRRGPTRDPNVSERWEFPGGKIEPGEHPQEALIREINEELCIPITVGDHLLTVEHHYSALHITLHAYLCTTPAPEAIRLTEHQDLHWGAATTLQHLDLAPADIPIAEHIAQHF